MKARLLRLAAAAFLVYGQAGKARAATRLEGEGKTSQAPRVELPKASALPVRIDLAIPKVGDIGEIKLPLQPLQHDLSLPAPLAATQLSAPAADKPAERFAIDGAKPPQEKPAPKVVDQVREVLDADAQGARDEDEPLAAVGRVLFDQAAQLPDAAPSGPVGTVAWLKQSVSNWVKGPDILPAWPAKPGDRVRIDGKTYTLGRRIGESDVSVVYAVEGFKEERVVKIIHPDMKGVPHYAGEVEALKVLKHTGIPHAKLVAHSADGLVIVKELVEGETAWQVIEGGELDAKKRQGLAEIAAHLISMGFTADLALKNIVWDQWRSTWKIVDAGGAGPAPASMVISQILTGELRRRGAVDPVEFLSALRGRLGPDSTSWGVILSEGGRFPQLKRDLEALAKLDASLPKPPKIVFEPGRRDEVLDDTVVSYGEMSRRLGFDPQAVTTRIKLHTDDPGKTNTEVLELHPERGPPMVWKAAEKETIRREAAVRRVIRRWFGRYLDTPRSISSIGRRDGIMMMERVEGMRSYFETPLGLEQRIALFLLAATFGFGDVNEGNVLAGRDGKVWLIDFEVAFGPRGPVFGRLPYEPIAAEMPWVTRRSPNRPEDYFPAIAAWRELFLKPETQAQLAGILHESGYKDKEIPGLLAIFRWNLGRLEWVIQNDVEFANYFSARSVARPSR